MGRALAAGLLVLGSLYALWGPSTSSHRGDGGLTHRVVERYGVFGYRVIETRITTAGSWCMPPDRVLVVENPRPVERHSPSALAVTAAATAPVLLLGRFLARRVVSS